MRRRDFLSRAPIAMAAIGAPVAQARETTSPLRALYHEWQDAKRTYNEGPIGTTEAEACFRDLCDCDRRAAAFVPLTVEDFAFKVIFADDDGDMNGTPEQVALVAMAYQIVGLTPRQSLDSDTDKLPLHGRMEASR